MNIITDYSMYKHCCTVTVTNMAVVQNIMIVSDKFNMAKLVPMEIVLRNASPNCVSINLKFLLTPRYILKHFVESRSYMLFPELFINVNDVNVMCAEC